MHYKVAAKSRRIRWAEWILFLLLSFLMLTLPFDGYNILGWGSFFRLVGLSVLVLLPLLLVVDARLMETFLQRLSSGGAIGLVLFVVWSGATAFWAPNTEWALTRFVSYLGLLGITFAVALLSPAMVARLWVAMILGVIVSLPLGFILPHPNPLLVESGRFSSGGNDPNDYANLALIAFLVFYFGALHYTTQGFKRAYSLLGWVALLVVPLSGSRTAFVNTLFNLGIGFLRQGWRGTFALILVGGIAIAALYTFSEVLWVETFLQRVETLSNPSNEETWAGRFDIWQAAWFVFTQHLWIGVGAGNFAWVSPQFSAVAAQIASLREDGGGGVAHNSYLSVLAETGLVGFALFAWLQIALFYHLWKAQGREPLARGLLLGFLAYWVASLTLTWEYVKIAFILYGSALAVRGGKG